MRDRYPFHREYAREAKPKARKPYNRYSFRHRAKALWARVRNRLGI